MRGPRVAAPEESVLTRPSTDGAAEPPLVEIRVKAEFRPATRGIQPESTIDVAADDVLEIEFAEGLRVWMRSDEYRERFQTLSARDAAGAEFEVPASLPLTAADAPNRGVVGWAIKSLKVLGVDLHGRTALALADKIEKRKGLRRPAIGLFQCALEPDGFALSPAELPAKATDDRPYLVLLHGTLSSTWGSFGELWSTERARELRALKDTYADRVLGFEHQTLAVSPVQNALELVRALPTGATVHLISHSRGGLVGDLLCRSRTLGEHRGSSVDESVGAPFGPQELELLSGQQSGLLADLNRALKERRISVTRFARVACPALGTTLASGRLDRWLAVIGSVASKVLPGSPLAAVASDIGEFIAAVVKERTDPSTLPGVEAMMPESPFIRLMNWPSTTVQGDLYVISGGLEPDALWAKLAVWVTDRFYGGDHDLVVNTASMYGGAKRTGAALASFFEGPSVNHFNYFRNSDSAARLISAVTRGDANGFVKLDPQVTAIARDIEARGAAPRPTVIVLPGIMGSELTVGGDHIWLDLSDIILGEFKKLRIDGREKVEARAPFARYYGELLKFLTASHRVIPFPYDWRKDPREEANRLAKRIEAELPQAQSERMPIRILAHSMGGLVARVMIAEHGDIWRKMLETESARLVMLGTPNGGSHSITELLVARSKTLRQLALLDCKSGARGLLGIIARFPGVLAMLPKDAGEDYFAPETWQAYASAAGGNCAQPRHEDLTAAREVRALLDQAAFDRRSMLYVAGHARATICGMRIDAQRKDPRERIQFEATNRGDGRVTWDSGIPREVSTWYMDAGHGDLTADEAGFPAIADLLSFGDTKRLPTTAPVDRSAGETFPMPRDTDAIYPDDASLSAEVMGAVPTRRRRLRPRRAAPVRVSAVHGNLAFARFPVAVGHYAGDTIISAERALDAALGRQLSRRLQLGLYPGAVESSAVFANPRLRTHARATPKGAVVVGLGLAGVLSNSQLTRTFTRALLEYVTEWTEYEPLGPPADADGLGISALLIGSGMGGIGVADSVAACLRAVAQANDILRASNQGPRIAEIEFIELWRDRAIQTVSAFSRIEADEPALKGRFQFDPQLGKRKGARYRATFQEPSGWWHRIQIVGEEVPDSQRKALRFTAITRQARNEVRMLSTRRAQVDRYIEQAIRTTHHDATLSRTLFELLLPVEFKDASIEEGDIVLLLDDESAQYPWELLEDPLDGREGLERRPFICRHGVLRQLQSLEFRGSVVRSTSNDALVVGDPVSPFVELKGAQQEAQMVAHALDVGGRFRVNHLERPSGEEVMNALFDRPYRILHLAGHGVFDFLPTGGGKRDRVTGMVIGDGMFLTPSEVGQLRRVPELVFINCCHLGRIKPGQREEQLNRRDDYHRIAANLAQEFIRMGVRAVIAAGWAVDDDAAAAFARAFYSDMLAGLSFGQATRSARKLIFENSPSVNTWGAYQCYGDPDYRLVTDGADSGKSLEPSFATPEVAVLEIENLAALLETLGDRDPAWHFEELERIERWLRAQGWLDKPGVYLSLGRAYREAFRFEDAIRFFQLALREDSQSVSLRDIELLANMMSRRAQELAMTAQTKAQRSVADKLFGEAIELLQWISTPLAVASAGLTAVPADAKRAAERCALLGSLYKRRAWIGQDRMAVRQAVTEMSEHYEQALRRSPDKHYYPHFNALQARLVVQWVGAVSATERADWQRLTKPQVLAELAEVTGNLDTILERGPDFWADAARIDCDLLRQIVDGSLDGDAAQKLADRYLAIRVLSSRSEFASVRDQAEFLLRMADVGRQTEVVKPLTLLCDRLRGTTAAPG